jgi:uncharacterized protein (TIGR03435 family)
MTPDMVTAARFAANHLWQSTLTACAAAALAGLLRSGEARLRHGIWMAASLKFLAPFALLVAIGAQLGTRQLSAAPPIVTTMLEIGQPFAAAGPALHAHVPSTSRFPWFLMIGLLWAAGTAATLTAWTVRWLRVRTIARQAVLQYTGREADALRAAQVAAGLRHSIPLLVSKDCMEPGIFGIVRPVLLWPEGISAHLDDEQLAAVVAHEVCHVRRRDNLFALLQMCVQAMFWFHPLVWWMGARLLEERERACDEAVLALGNEPAQYADAILKACRFCVESPLTCISGVSGSDLKRRMVRIMNAATVPLSRSRKMLLASVAVATIAGPIVMGALHPRVVRADEAQNFANLRFDSATLAPSAQSAGRDVVWMQHNGEFINKNITMKDLIALAYGVRPERVVGGPDWLNTQRFDFEAHWTPAPRTQSTVPPPPPPEMAMRSETIAGPGHAPGNSGAMGMLAPAPLQAMLRNFLAEHVNLKLRDDSQVLPVYELTVANGGSKLTPSRPPSNVTQVRMESHVDFRVQSGQHTLAITNGDLRILCNDLTERLGNEVVDKTGLTGRYNFEISFPAQADPDQLASILRDQYGLDLQSSQQPVRVFAIDNVDMPQPN